MRRGRVAARRLDLDDVGAEVAQYPAAKLPLGAGEVERAETVEHGAVIVGS